MLNKLSAFLREYEMVQPGDLVVCAVSGGADSIALLFAFYLLREKLGISLAAAHYNHNLRGAESQEDEAFVRDFCRRYGIPLTVGSGVVTPGEKGLEAAAREARYAFFAALSGKIATAHTADDNAETLLLHLLRGTGLKGLGGIAPVRGNLIRPMLTVTRREVLAFLEEYHLRWVEDSSNAGDAFLRNRLRHQVFPLLRAENPRLAETLSTTALRLREDEALLSSMTAPRRELDVPTLRAMPAPLQARAAAGFLAENGLRDVQQAQIAQVLELARSEKPSARADLPGGRLLLREYDRIVVSEPQSLPECVPLPCPGRVEWQDVAIICTPGKAERNTCDCFSVAPVGPMVIRSRLPGDEMTLSGGTKSLKKLFIDRKIPALRRPGVPVVADGRGVLGVYGLGANLSRAGESVTIQFQRNAVEK